MPLYPHVCRSASGSSRFDWIAESLLQRRPRTAPVHGAVVLFPPRRRAVLIALHIRVVIERCAAKQLMAKLMDGCRYRLQFLSGQSAAEARGAVGDRLEPEPQDDHPLAGPCRSP